MMAMTTFLCVLLLALLILLFLRQLWSRRHLPPGPLALPLIGSLGAYGIWLCEDYITKHVKRYGNISTLWIGPQCLVVLSGFKTVKEGMTSFQEEFLDRINDPLMAPLGKEKVAVDLVALHHSAFEVFEGGKAVLRRLESPLQWFQPDNQISSPNCLGPPCNWESCKNSSSHSMLSVASSPGVSVAARSLSSISFSFPMMKIFH